MLARAVKQMAESAPRPHVLVGCTGSVATVKVPQLALSISKFADVRVVATEHALHFLSEGVAGSYAPEAWAAFKASGVRVYRDADEWKDYKSVHGDPVVHIELRKWADVVLVAPLGANTLAKLANGLCDNLLTSVCRVHDPTSPLVLAPAMNTMMWDHPITEAQLTTLRGWGAAVVPPVVKTLACGDTGTGAMASVEDVTEAVRVKLAHLLEGADDTRALEEGGDGGSGVTAAGAGASGS
mmetsp:Transcript_79526/g.221133  ORF Transcript_79526/g.221133 Transcript_79526/m.221133 type:complete len:240 (+) Transcript_79526:13-732(+)